MGLIDRGRSKKNSKVNTAGTEHIMPNLEKRRVNNCLADGGGIWVDRYHSSAQVCALGVGVDTCVRCRLLPKMNRSRRPGCAPEKINQRLMITMQNPQSRDTKTDTSASSKPLIDIERVAEVIDLICEGEPAAFARWIDHLETDVAKFAALLAGAGTTESIRSLQGAAHALKGTCLNLGASALGGLFAALERDAKEGNLTTLHQRYAGGRELKAQSIRALREVAGKSDVGAPDN
jgi:HPt (histidine-containing phosphotransfer) domain-containing protein